MARTRIASVREPFASRPGAAEKAAQVVLLAEFMGAVPESHAEDVILDAPLMHDVLGRLADQGVGRAASRRFVEPEPFDGAWAREFEVLLEAMEHSPMPTGEWAPVTAILGEDLLSELVGISTTSMRRYASAQRVTPDVVAGRLHLLTLVVADLAGAYNDYGIRRWFDRPRTALDGRSPRVLLQGGFDPDGEAAVAVRGLAGRLIALGAA